MPYYAVARTKTGSGIGIYKDWESAKRHCIDESRKPSSDSRFKKFDTHAQAVEFLCSMKVPVAWAYFQHDQGAVFDNLEEMISTLGRRWNAVGEEIDFVQRNSRASAEKWLLEKMVSIGQRKHKRKSTSIETELDCNSNKKINLKKHYHESKREEMNDEVLPNDEEESNSLMFQNHIYKDNTKVRPLSSTKTNDFVVVWTDGACIDNGKPHAKAGYGVYFGAGDPRNCYGPFPLSNHTNQRAELYAIKKVLEITKHERRKLLVKSDSKYSIRCLSEWLPTWRSNGFITANKTSVKNRDLIEAIDHLIKQRGESMVEFEHVQGHSGEEGNEAADRLASQGALQTM